MARYIDADLLKSKLRNVNHTHGNCIALRPVYMVSDTDIDNIPTADAVEVVHAEWISYTDNITGKPFQRCSNCDYPHKYKESYCCNCGAKIDKESV